MTSSADNRTIFVPVDDSEGSEQAMQWVLKNLYRQGDEIHVFHVVPSPQSKLLGAGIGLADAGEFMVTPPDPSDDKKQVTKASDFIEQRFVSKLEASRVPHKVEITHFNTDKDSIAELICFRAEELKTPAVIMSKHSQGAIKEFFMGSVTKYCTQHCKQPVIILH